MKVKFQKIIKRQDLKDNPEFFYLFGDNNQRVGMGGQAAEMRGEKNSIGIATKWGPGGAAEDFFSDEKFDEIKEIIDADLRNIPRGKVTVVIPKDGLGTGLAELPTRAPKVYAYLCEELKKFETMPDVVKGYKAFNIDDTCRGFKYTEGKEFKIKGAVKICSNGFHFCEKAVECFNENFSNYNFDKKKSVVREVEARGIVYTDDDGKKCVTDCIYIGRALTWDEVLDIVNIGSGNSGKENSGDLNSGYRNSGECNNTNHSSGVFNSKESNILMFNKPSNWKFSDWMKSEAREIIANNFELIDWEWDGSIQPQEGKQKVYKYQEAWKKLWDKITDRQKKIIQKLPNFNKEVFKEVTGIDL